MKTRIIMLVPFVIIGILLAGGCVPKTQYDKWDGKVLPHR